MSFGPGSLVAAEERADALAAPPPVGTRFAEPLENQRIRFRYLWRRTKAQGMMASDRDASPNFIFQNPNQPFTETSRALDVSVHTLEVAYAPHPRTTLIAQVPIVMRDLETVDVLGVRRKDQTEGLGDVLLGLAVPFIRKRNQMSHVHVAFDFPTGSSREHGRNGIRLPYDSQLGNGSVDFEWGWTYRGSHARFSWGGQALGRHAIEANGHGYREGSRFEGSLWGGARIAAGLSATARAVWQKSSNLHGHDPLYDTAPNLAGEQVDNPAKASQARGGTRLFLAPGLAWDLPGVLRGNRLSVEVALPVYQNLDGPQLEQDWNVTTGWQWAF